MTDFEDRASGFEACEWHAVYTRHQHEKTVAENLSARGLEIFLPLYEAVRQWNDRQKRLMLPLFPCYVFFRGSQAHRMKVLSAPGVYSIVGFAGSPAVIEKSQIDAIRLAVENHLPVEPHPFLRHGDHVRVRSGPLAGIEGILIRKRGLTRLVLSAELLQKSVSVEVDASCVERIGIGMAFAS
jgi:transcription antitermination factor NusG